MTYVSTTEISVTTIEAELTLPGSTSSLSRTDLELLSLSESSQSAPYFEASVRVNNMTLSELKRISIVDQKYYFNQTVAPRASRLTVRQYSDGVVNERTWYCYAISGTHTKNEEGENAVINLVSLDALMTLTNVLWEGQKSTAVIFEAGKDIDSTWNEAFNYQMANNNDYSFIRAQTGLSWNDHSSPGPNTRLSYGTTEDVTYWQIASTIAQLFGKYIRQHTENPLAWQAADFVDYSLPTMRLNYHKNIYEEVTETAADTWGDVVDFTWETTKINDYGRELVKTVSRIGKRSRLLGKVREVEIQPRAAQNYDLLTRAHEMIRDRTWKQTVTTLLDLEARVGMRVETLDGYFYIASVQHNGEDGTTTLQLDSHYSLAEAGEHIWGDLARNAWGDFPQNLTWNLIS